MVLFTDQIKFLSCLLMTGKAVQTETIIHVFETALIDLAAVLAHVNGKELPVMGCGIEAFLLFDLLGPLAFEYSAFAVDGRSDLLVR